MKILVSGDFFKLIKSLENLSLDEKSAPFAEKTLAVSLSDKAEANARNVIGNGPFGQELLVRRMRLSNMISPPPMRKPLWKFKTIFIKDL